MYPGYQPNPTPFPATASGLRSLGRLGGRIGAGRGSRVLPLKILPIPTPTSLPQDGPGAASPLVEVEAKLLYVQPHLPPPWPLCFFAPCRSEGPPAYCGLIAKRQPAGLGKSALSENRKRRPRGREDRGQEKRERKRERERAKPCRSKDAGVVEAPMKRPGAGDGAPLAGRVAGKERRRQTCTNCNVPTFRNSLPLPYLLGPASFVVNWAQEDRGDKLKFAFQREVWLHDRRHYPKTFHDIHTCSLPTSAANTAKPPCSDSMSPKETVRSSGMVCLSTSSNRWLTGEVKSTQFQWVQARCRRFLQAPRARRQAR